MFGNKIKCQYVVTFTKCERDEQINVKQKLTFKFFKGSRNLDRVYGVKKQVSL